MKRTELKRTPFKRKYKPSKNDFSAAVKATIRSRSGGLCEAHTASCRGKAVLFHHILRRTQGGKGTVANGLHLCVPCHLYIHDQPAISYERGWLGRRVDS